MFGLPSWHFVGRVKGNDPGSPSPVDISPYCGVIDGLGMVCAFSSSLHAHRFAVLNELVHPKHAIPLLSMKRDGAISCILGLAPNGVEKVIFDHKVGGDLFAATTNLVPMYSFFSGAPLGNVARAFSLDPIIELGARFSENRTQRNADELFAELYRLPEWYWFADDQFPESLYHRDALDGLRTLVLFTSLASVEAGVNFFFAGPTPRKARVHRITPPAAFNCSRPSGLRA